MRNYHTAANAANGNAAHLDRNARPLPSDIPTISSINFSGSRSGATMSGYLFSISLPAKYLWITLDSRV